MPPNPVLWTSNIASAAQADWFNAFVPTVDNFPAARKFIGEPGMRLYIAGAAAINDGGQGMFSWTLGSAVDDNSTIIVPPNAFPPAYWSKLTGGGGGGGTVTNLSIVTANGFGGTVANSTTTPAVTLTTSITGVVKGNGTVLSAATAGGDYVAPSAYASANGLTLNTSRLLGRTTASSGPAEEITVGSGLSLSAGVLATSGGGSGTVTSVALSGGTTGITVSGSPITTAGTITLAGTLATANGGTGLTSFTSGGAMYATSTSVLTTGTLPVSAGGTNASSAGITAFNNITGYSAAGATGTTSTNLVFSTSPSLATPTITGALTYGGVTLSASVTGTGSMVLANHPTITGGATINGGLTLGTALAIAQGGTGATTAAAALAALGGLGVTASSLASPGYLEFSNGLFLMWGSKATSGSGDLVVSYNTELGITTGIATFSNAVISGGNTTDTTTNYPYVSATSITGFTVHSVSGTASTFFWFAVGA